MKKTSRARNGFSMLYAAITMSVTFAFSSLAIDYGRVQLSKTELRQAADAAARYALAGMSDSTYVSKAQSAASQNSCNGTAVSLQASDVVAGNWTNGVFTAAGAPLNAVRVTAARTKARGTAIPLLFASLIGQSSCDVSGVSIAYQDVGTGYGLVGMNTLTLSGNGVIDSYDASAGAYSAATKKANADPATGGAMTLSGNAKVYGDAFYGTTYSASGNAGVVSPGTAQKLSTALNYPNPVLPASYTNKGAFSKSGNGTVTLAAGNYYYTSFSISGNYKLNVTGKVNIYMGGPMTLSGNVTTLSNLPGNLRIYTVAATSVTLSGNSALYADVYAPNSTVSISGNNDIYGRVIGKTLTASGNGGMHYDESLGATGGSKPIALVK